MTGPENNSKVPEPVPPLPLPEFAYADLDKQERIGTGGDANVYRATLEHDGYTYSVAIKEPRFEGTIQKRTIEKFQNEAETWAGLNDHDNIVSVYSWGAQPIPWLALEHMDGGTLETRIGDADIPEALWLAGRIAEGIRYGHRHGVAHLDIKPTNILLRETGPESWNYPKVSDWGLAKLLLEHSNSVEGISPTYAAPEQFDAEEFGSPDDITDIYQLGTVVYALVTGEPPFRGSSTAVMRSVLDDEPRPPSEVNSEVPSDVDEIVLKALAKRKEDRYEGVLPFRHALDELFAGVADTGITSGTSNQPSTDREESTASPAVRSDSKSGTDTEQTDAATAITPASSSGENQSTDSSGPLTRRQALGLLGIGGGVTGGLWAMGDAQLKDSGGGDEGSATETSMDGGDGDEETATETEGDMESGGEPIALASLFPITGTNSAYGGGHQRAFNLAVEEINDAGGILSGREIAPANRDTEGSPSRAAQKFRTEINQEGIVGLVGPYSSGIGATLAPIARDNRVMEISNGNTSPSLATAGVNESNGVKYYGRTSPNDLQQALVMARVLNQSIPALTASFLYVDNPYGQGLAEAASENFDGETLNMVAYSQATSDYTSTLDSVFEGDPDAVGAVMYPGNGRTILQQWNQGGYGGDWVGAEAILSPELLTDLSEIVEGMYITSPQTANSHTFQENMGGSGQITQFAPHAYDATYLMGLAMERAGEASGTSIAENIRLVSRGEGTTVGVGEFQAAKEALANGDEVNYEGASGSVDLNENLEPVVPYHILQVSNGYAQVVEEVPPSYFQDMV